MKLIFKLTILLILIVGISLRKVEKKVERKVQRNSKAAKLSAKVKADGGNYQEGLTCGSGLYATVNGVQKFYTSELKFYPLKTESQTGLNKLGFLLEFKEEPVHMLEFLIKDQSAENTYYMPYRFMSKEVTFYHGGYSFKSTFNGELTNDSNEVLTFILYLPYAYTTYYIKQEESQQLIALINKFRLEQREIVEVNRGKMIKISGEYLDQLNIFTAKDSDDKKSQTKKSISQKEDLLEKAIESQTKLNESTTVLAEELRVADERYNEINSKIINLQNQVVNNQEVLEKLQKTNVEEDIKKNTKATLLEYEALEKELLLKLPESRTEIEAAKKGLLELKREKFNINNA